MFYPLYQAYEQIIYPKEKYEEVLAWHLRLPEVSQLFGFLFLGYLFGYVWNTVHHYRLSFLAFGLFSVVSVTYIILFLPRVDKRERVSPEGFVFKLDREFLVLLLSEGILTLAWGLAPEFILLNYVIFILKKTIFEVMIIEALMSIATIFATYICERIRPNKKFMAIGAGVLLMSVYALIMALSPPLLLVIIAYFIGRFGDSLAFPFYRAWMFSLIPNEKASEIHAALSSYRRIISLIIPLIAGFIANIKATLPYFVSFFLFVFLGVIFLFFKKVKEEKSHRI